MSIKKYLKAPTPPASPLTIIFCVLFLMAAAGISSAQTETSAPPDATGAVLDSAETTPDPADATLTKQELESLREAGLKENTLDEFQALFDDRSRTRPPAVTFNEIDLLLEEGFVDDTIRLLIKLDSVTGKEARIPITPAQVSRLAADGISPKTIQIMLASEIARFAEEPSTVLKTENKGSGWGWIESLSPKDPGIGVEPEVEMVTKPDPQGKIADIKLGRQVIEKPDGKKVMVYSSPFDDQDVKLGRRVYNKPGGKQTIVYSSPFEGAKAKLGRIMINRPDGKQVVVYYSADSAAMKRKRENEILKAREILEKLQLQLDVNDYLHRGRGRRK